MHSHERVIKLIGGSANGRMMSVVAGCDVVRCPVTKPSWGGWRVLDHKIPERLHEVRVDEYIIHRLPSGAWIGLISTMSLAKLIDDLIAAI